MAHFKILEPIWKDRSVGLNDERIEDHNTIEILYRTKNGELLYPTIFQAEGSFLRQYPTKMARGTLLRIVSIKDLEDSDGEDLLSTL